MNEIVELLRRHVADCDASWSVGSFGAVAEFLRDEGEAAEIGEGGLAAATARGALRVEPVPGLRPLAYETATSKGRSWSQTLAFCLPESDCAMAGRSVLTEIGLDRAAIRREDRAALLFDLGLGQPYADICIRTGESDLIETLRAVAGRSLFEPGNPAMGAIVTAGPHRVFATRAARCEVYQPIPPADGRSPLGPHTHILPQLLKAGQTHAATAPIPEGWVPVVNLFPAHPARDMMGGTIPFRSDRLTAFTALMEAFAPPSIAAYRQEALRCLGCGIDPPPPSTRFRKSCLHAVRRQYDLQERTPADTGWDRYSVE